jgi:hypothetical protein
MWQASDAKLISGSARVADALKRKREPRGLIPALASRFTKK